MAHNSAPRDGDRAPINPGVLPANTDDPRFADDHGPRAARPAEWTTGGALAADLLAPLDEARTITTSRAGLAALVEAGMQAMVEALGTLLSHWGH
jgi:hypothetical protein